MTRDSFSSSPVYRIRMLPASTWTRVLLPWVNGCHLHCCFNTCLIPLLTGLHECVCEKQSSCTWNEWALLWESVACGELEVRGGDWMCFVCVGTLTGLTSLTGSVPPVCLIL